MNNVVKSEIQREALQSYLRESLKEDSVALPTDVQTVLGGLAESVTMLPLVFMSLLMRAAAKLKAKAEDIQVLDALLPQGGSGLAIIVKDVQVGRVNFLIDHSNGFEMSAYLSLTPEAVELIDAEKETEITVE